MDYSNLDLEKIKTLKLQQTSNTAIYKYIPLWCKLGKMPSNIHISFKNLDFD